VNWIVREIVKQEYTYEIEASSAEEATQIAERGEALDKGRCIATRELKPQYITSPKGFEHSRQV